MVIADRLARGGHTLEVAVGNGLVHIGKQGVSDGIGHTEAEGGRVAGVQAQNLDALFAHALAFEIQRTADIGMDGLQIFGTID